MKDQFVIAYLADLTMSEAVVSHAAFMARMLNKGIILLYVEDKKLATPPAAEAERAIADIEKGIADLRPAHVIMKEGLQAVIDALPTLLNGVVAVAGVDTGAAKSSPTHPRTLLRLFKNCKIAYLTVQTPLADSHAYDRTAFGIDFRKESKDKLIWASYMARFHKSRLTMLHFQYRDEGLRGKWRNNVLFMNKFFKTLGVSYDSRAVDGHALFPETIICDNASLMGCGLLISVTTDTRDLDIIEWIVGTQEQRTIRNAAKMPVLFINPRNDIYVLCD